MHCYFYLLKRIWILPPLCFSFPTVNLMLIFFLASSSETAWSPRCAVEKTRLATTRPPPVPSPKLRLHPSHPARWPPLDPYPSSPPFSVPSVPAHWGTHHRQAALRSIGQSSWLTSPCVFTVAAQLHLWWDWHTQEPACVFSIHLIVESVQLASQSLTWHQGGVVRVVIQLNTFQAPHYSKHIIGENLIQQIMCIIFSITTLIQVIESALWTIDFLNILVKLVMDINHYISLMNF